MGQQSGKTEAIWTIQATLHKALENEEKLLMLWKAWRTQACHVAMMKYRKRDRWSIFTNQCKDRARSERGERKTNDDDVNAGSIVLVFRIS